MLRIFGVTRKGWRAHCRVREIKRLVDAIASVGISEALQARLLAAERERRELRPTGEIVALRAPDEATVLRTCRALLMRLEAALAADTARARGALQQLLGDARLVAEGDAVYADMETRADRLLLDAMGAGVSNSGCGEGFEPSTFGL